MYSYYIALISLPVLLHTKKIVLSHPYFPRGHFLSVPKVVTCYD